MSEKLFVYGTLADPQVQLKVLKRVLNKQPASLSGFIKTPIIINGNQYFIIEKIDDLSQKVFGHVLDIEKDDLKDLDEYETSSYQRCKVKLDNNIMAWVYHK